MKNIILILLFSLVFVSTFGQKIRFSDSTNVWYGYNWDLADVPHYANPYTYAYTGEIIINDTLYKQIGSGNLIREDTVLNKVYLGKNLLYDYNLHVGDTFNFAGVRPHYVSAMDSVLINSAWYRTWHFVPINDSSQAGIMPAEYDVIAGIGCLNDPFYPANPVFSEVNITLTCFSNKGITPPLNRFVGDYFNNSTSCSLTFGLAVKNTKINDVTTEIFPNPANTDLTIASTKNLNSISVTNLIGKTVFDKLYNSQEVQIDVSDLPPGIYFLKINGTEARKFVKQ